MRALPLSSTALARNARRQEEPTMGNKPYAVIAVIQHQVRDQLDAFIANRDQNPGQLAAGDTDLWQQLIGKDALPRNVDLSFLHEIGSLALPQLFRDGGDPLDIVKALFQHANDNVTKLLSAKSPQDALAVCNDIFTGDLSQMWSTVGPMLASQFSILVSFATTVPRLPVDGGKAVGDAVLKYFFTTDGYQTVDGTKLVSPVQLSDIDLQALGHLKSIFAGTAERYVRDLVRLTVEAADDARYNDLPQRYQVMLQRVGDQNAPKYESWFKGFSSIAEAAVTSAVEEACLGVSTFQTNSLIAASAGTFAGTAARKATQHVFLAELEHLVK
jgi:hypothetical protein